MAARAATLWISAALAGCAPWRGDARAWSPERAVIATEVQARARPLDAVDADPRMAAAVWEMTRGARVIGVGEATHGTREFRLLLHSMVMNAARDGRPLAVAIELPFNHGLALDAWVRDTWYPHDPAIRGRAFSDRRVFNARWLIAVEEVRALFEWIGEWNEAAPPDKQIRVAGIDECNDRSCGVELASYINDIDARDADRVAALVEPLRGDALEHAPRRAGRARASLAELRRLLDARRERITERHGSAAFDAARRLVWLAERRVDSILAESTETQIALRERTMADTVAWISDQLGPDGVVLVYAHNGHVGREIDRYEPDWRTGETVMGQELAARFGDAYTVVYTTFDRGSVLATLDAPRKTSALRAFPVTSAPEGTLEAAVRSTAPYALDVREAATESGALARYLHTTHWTRCHTSYWRRTHLRRSAGWNGVTPARDFDVLVFFPTASASQLYRPGS